MPGSGHHRFVVTDTLLLHERVDVSNPTVDTLLQHVGVSDDEPVVPAAEPDSAEEGQQ